MMQRRDPLLSADPTGAANPPGSLPNSLPASLPASPLKRRGVLLGGIGAAALLPLAGCGLFDEDKKPVLAGRREDVLTVGAGLTVDESDTTPISLPAAVPGTDWMQPGRVPSHESINLSVGSLTDGSLRNGSPGGSLGGSQVGSLGSNQANGLAPRWSTRLGAGQNGRLVLAAEPVVADNRIYAMDARGIVNAFEAGTGRRLWQTDTKPKKSRSSNVGGGLSFSGGVVYVVDGVAESLALDAGDGRILWRVNVGTPGRSAPTVADGRMFFGTIDERLFALDISSGRQLWVYQASASETIVFGQPAPALVGSTLLAGFGSGDIAALRAETGELLWSDTLGSTGGRNSILDFSSVHGLPVISDGTAYVISVGRVLTAIDLRSGRRLWERAVGGKDDLVVVGNWMFLLSQDQQLACLDKTNGHVRWVTTLPRFRRPKPGKGPIGWAGPLLVDGQLVCVSDFPRQGMISVDALTGTVSRIIALKRVAALPPIAADGAMLLITDDGELSAYG